MIQAQISIRMRGQLYRYTRDVVNDTFGKNGLYYGYRGNARRKLVLSQRNISSSANSGLERGIVYSFRVGVNGGTIEDYKVSFQGDKREPITFFDLMRSIAGKSSDFDFIWEDYERENEGFYFIANGVQANTSIVVEDGNGPNPLFANLNLFEEISDEFASDNFFDQTDAGQIKADFDALTTSLEDDTQHFLSFPESGGATNLLVRPNNESKGALVFNQLARHVVENLHVVEIVKNTRFYK